MSDMTSEYFYFLIDQSPDLITVVDQDLRFTIVNQRAKDLLGYAKEEIIGQPLQIIYEDDQELERIKELDSRHEGLSGYRTRILDKNGNRIPISISTVSFFDPEGNYKGGMAVFRDIRKELEEEHRHIDTEKAASVGLLASCLTHELNNLLGVIRGHTEYALAEKDASITERSLRIIIETVDRASRLTGNLLDFSGKIEPCWERGSISEVVARTIDLVGLDLAKKNIAIDRKFSVVPDIVLDAALLQQTFLGLILNAMHSMSQAGRLGVAIDQEGGWVRVEISDTGRGISREDLSMIFVPFFSTKSLSEDGPPGTGLGLTIAKNIVELHHGAIHVESEIGKGTRIIMRFPLSSPLTVDAPPPPRSVRKADVHTPEVSGPLRILIVDDEEKLSSLISDIYIKEGHQVRCAPEGGKALELLDEQDADLLLVDFLMPGMSGMDFVRALRTRGKMKCIVLLTGGIQKDQEQEVLDQGIFRILRKPFTLNELRRIIHDYRTKWPGHDADE